MRTILHCSESSLSVNALFLQPTRWCGLECNNCYVHSHAKNDEHIPVEEWCNLFDAFYNSENYWANQITLSVDNIPTWDKNKTEYMLRVFEHIVMTVFNDERKIVDRPEVHITANSSATLIPYINRSSVKHINLTHLNLITFSHISSDDTTLLNYFKSWKTETNWNCMVPSHQIKDMEIDRIIRLSDMVSQVYLLLNKDPMGHPNNQLTQLNRKDKLSATLSNLDRILKKVPQDKRSKFIVDGCIRDSIGFRKTGFGCSANISKFQVWPNGSVSGCPYAYDRNNERRARTYKDILGNIREAKKQYDFKDICTIPNDLNSIR